MTRERTKDAIQIASALTAAAGSIDLDYERIAPDELAAWRLRRDADAVAQKIAHDPRPSRILASGFPRRAVEYAVTVDDSNPAIAMVRDWDPSDRCMLLISGANGVGKTVAAAWWALRRKTTPMFVRAAEFARTSRYDRYGDDGGKARWLASPELVLDDVGAEFFDSKGSFLVDLDELVDVFYGDRRPLLITTNVPGGSFPAMFGARIADRIRECGVFFEWDGPSLRGGAP